MSKIRKLTKQQMFLDWTVDLQIYIVVLNLFVQYSEDFYIESFSISILVATTLKVILYYILKLEHNVTDFFKIKLKGKYKKLHILSVFSILFFSKFLILEVINVLFGEYVEIYGFVSLVLLILTMILTRKVLDRIYSKLEE